MTTLTSNAIAARRAVKPKHLKSDIVMLRDVLKDVLAYLQCYGTEDRDETTLTWSAQRQHDLIQKALAETARSIGGK
jgi:uncharacterized protein YprB with RNaseH-like and TPR domain